MRYFLLVFALLGWLSPQAAAQIVEKNHRAENRRALREARKHPAPYKDSHLAVDKEALKRGAGGRSAEASKERKSYKFDKTGTARVSEPSTVSLRLRKKKKDSAIPQ